MDARFLTMVKALRGVSQNHNVSPEASDLRTADVPLVFCCWKRVNWSIVSSPATDNLWLCDFSLRNLISRFRYSVKSVALVFTLARLVTRRFHWLIFFLLLSASPTFF